MTILFGRTQQALDTPFEPNRLGYGGVLSDIESTDVQNAIEEVKIDAINNDRYLLLCSYGGNANTGRYMEFFAGIDSSIAPIYLATQSRCLTIVVGATANSTANIGFFDLTASSITPVYTVVLTNEALKVVNGTAAIPLFVVNSGARLAIRVTSGSIAKPHIYFSLSAST